MANTGAAPEFTWDLSANLEEDESVKSRIKLILANMEAAQRAADSTGILEDTNFDDKSLASLLLTYVNGERGLPDQKVTVEYLSNDRLLRIPHALGMSVITDVPGMIDTDATLLARYAKVSSLTYRQLRRLAQDNRTMTTLRTAIDATVARQVTAVDWDSPEYLGTGEVGSERDPPSRITTLFSIVSMACQFNCDLRDTSALLRADMRLADSAWKAGLKHERFLCKLRPLTLLMTAALNLAAVGGYGVAAWVRAYGLAAGILPDSNSACVSEYIFVKSQPTQDSKKAVTEAQALFQDNHYAFSVSIIAMFGLFHLNKDHTFKTNDAAMTRICKSYVNTLRTMVGENIQSGLMDNMEAVCRTAAHPFGLGQTYTLARVLADVGKLPPALGIRKLVAPPPVQRFFIARAAMREWGGLDAGRLINEAYADQRFRIENFCSDVEKNPPAYSHLHRLYGLDLLLGPQEIEQDAITAVMPMVVGYAEAQHVSSENGRDGIALAQSLANVKRDCGGLVTAFTNLWTKYIETLERKGIAEFAIQKVEGTA